jgi:hypothetical protein
MGKFKNVFHFFKTILILSSHLLPGLPCGLFKFSDRNECISFLLNVGYLFCHHIPITDDDT